MIVKGRKDLFLGLLLIVLPTIFISYPLLEYVSDHYSLLFINKGFLTIIFSVGMISAYFLHSTRLRFLLVFGLLILVLYLAYRSISAFPFTEFDAYYIANRFRINATIFVIGWFTGFGITRWRYFLVFFSVILICISIVTISSIGELNVEQLVWLFAPPVFYSFYILFIKELLYNIRHQAKISYGKILVRLVAFSTLVFLLFWLTTQLLQSKFEEIEQEIADASGNSENDGENSNNDSMLDKDSKNMFRLKEYTQLRPRLRQSDELLFCAYMDNFIGEGIPNPQYITLYHLNQYNSDLERFEIDPDEVVNDVFLPDPTEIPNYFTQIDTTVLIHDKMEKEYKQVNSTIYINQLSPDVFVAPSTAFACQPISVEEEYKDQYKFAYNVISEVSTLNSAYFVYNARDSGMLAFQEQRYEILRGTKSYDSEPDDFMAYYTRMPEGPLFDRIKNLADSLSEDADNPIDKVISIRDYFLSKDGAGKALYTYTLTPGSPTDPNIPDASLLHNFLFNTQKGYCTYFAASSLFMLRSLGIPVRMAVGFMTVDRSHNNPGWYWFYADQAHAWTQVYFPEYGWLDFDMTISNEGGQEAPQPDATPPTPPVDAHFVGRGIITKLDTLNKTIVIGINELIVKDEGIELTESRTFEVNAKKAKVYAGKESIKFTDLQPGDSAVVVSFDQSINQMRRKRRSESTEAFLDRLPEVINIQEVHIPEGEEEIDETIAEEETDIAKIANQWAVYLLVLLVLITLVLLIAPYLHYRYLLGKVEGNKDLQAQAVSIYRHLHFILNQMGVGRGNSTPMNYARDMVDPKFATNLEGFVAVYLKLKYSREMLTDGETQIIKNFYPDFNKTILKAYTQKEKILAFLKIHRWIYFLLNLNLSK